MRIRILDPLQPSYGSGYREWKNRPERKMFLCKVLIKYIRFFVSFYFECIFTFYIKVLFLSEKILNLVFRIFLGFFCIFWLIFGDFCLLHPDPYHSAETIKKGQLWKNSTVLKLMSKGAGWNCPLLSVVDINWVNLTFSTVYI